MLQHRIGRELLLGSQLTVKRRLQGLSIVTFVADDHANVQVRQDLTNICQAAARETDVMRIFLGAADDAWLVVCWQPHRLRLVELWILECRDTQQPVSQPRRQSVLGDVDLVAEDEFKRLRESPATGSSFRRRDGGAVHGAASSSSATGRLTPRTRPCRSA